MAIRMTDDPEDNRNDNYDDNNSGGGRGGGSGFGGLANILMMALPFLIRRPKLLIALLVIGGAVYYFGGMGGGSRSHSGGLATGADLKKEEYDKAAFFAPLSETGNTLPESVTLERYAPRRLNQGQQGSCVAWASAYAARSIMLARQTGQDPNKCTFSPSFLYNQIHLEDCQGAYIQYAMEHMQGKGLVPYNEFGYDENDCSTQPNSTLKQMAQQYRTSGFERLAEDSGENAVDILAIKQNIAQGAPVVIGMMVGGTFMQDMRGGEVWKPTSADFRMEDFGGHAMCVIGYDDNKANGAFQIMNSWGDDWGRKGICWVTYKDFKYFVKEAYGLHPMGAANNAQSSVFKVDFGLLDNATQRNIALTQKSPTLFATRQPIKKGDRFKIQVGNSIECYTYILGQEATGESYVLFPYTPKHSPYCGITGTRVFPAKQSLTADDVGNKDFMAVIVTKKAIDVNALNRKVNASRAATYEGKLNEALRGETATNVKFKAGETISFECDAKDKNAVGVVIELDKL